LSRKHKNTSHCRHYSGNRRDGTNNWNNNIITWRSPGTAQRKGTGEAEQAAVEAQGTEAAAMERQATEEVVMDTQEEASIETLQATGNGANLDVCKAPREISLKSCKKVMVADLLLEVCPIDRDNIQATKAKIRSSSWDSWS
jgi:hypothetical protein